MILVLQDLLHQLLEMGSVMMKITLKNAYLMDLIAAVMITIMMAIMMIFFIGIMNFMLTLLYAQNVYVMVV